MRISCEGSRFLQHSVLRRMQIANACSIEVLPLQAAIVHLLSKETRARRRELRDAIA